MNLKEALLESLEIILKNYNKLGEVEVLDLSLSNTTTDDNETTEIATINIEIIPTLVGEFILEEGLFKREVYDEFDKLQFSESEEIK